MPDLQRKAVPEPKGQNGPSTSVSEVLTAFHGVRATIAELLDAVGVDSNKTRESARVLGLNRGLAWRLTRVVRSTDASTVISDVPGRQSMTKFFNACRELGASEESVRKAVEAIDAFERAVGSCSGDRKTLAMLMANHDEGAASNEQERARRKLFEGACSVWGVQASVRFVTVFVFPADDDPTMLDAGHVTGYVDFRRLSPRPWPMSYEAVHEASGEERQFRKEPLDPTGSSEGQLQLLTSFCDPPDPRINVIQSAEFKRFELAAGPVGNEGLTTCVFGSHLRHLYERYSEQPETAGFMVMLQTPVERVVFDVYVHRDLDVQGPPPAQLLDRLTYTHGNRESDLEMESLPLAEQPVALSGTPGAVICTHIPWYPRLLDFVTQRIGHGLDEFQGSRFEMAYPPISTTLSRRFDLHQPPRS